MSVVTAVIPAAGLGTRFLPFTKSIPKEMLPLIDKPAMHYILEELVDSGIKTACVIVDGNRQSLIDHFEPSLELDIRLREAHKEHLLKGLERIIKSIRSVYIRQSEPLGLGHAVSLARPIMNTKEYFGVVLPDDIIVGDEPGLAQLIRIAQQEKGSVIAVQEVPSSMVSSYGVIGIKKRITANLFQVSHIVEKPDFKNAPSTLGVIGRYILSHKIFSAFDDMSVGTDGEFQLTDAISAMMHAGEKVFAYKLQGMRYDIGTPIGWIKAVVSMAALHPEYGPHVRKMLNELSTSESVMFNRTMVVEHTIS